MNTASAKLSSRTGLVTPSQSFLKPQKKGELRYGASDAHTRRHSPSRVLPPASPATLRELSTDDCSVSVAVWLRSEAAAIPMTPERDSPVSADMDRRSRCVVDARHA